ncbi:MAG: biosynthetic arginine decarboxylase [Gammaproteobacteria bacterium]|nr:biosynthetic arginine decarboxylase [Gammaproteobacteria bacterium]
MTSWTSLDAKATYCMENWGEGYVDVAEDGHLLIRPYRNAADGEVDMKKLLQEVQQQMSLPVLIRFQDILHDRVNQLAGAFAQAFEKHQYASRYTSVYPIKVNQQFSVVSEILNRGDQRVGLEAGSKPELMAVLSLAEAKRHTIICNGYKDSEYIRLALIAQRLGHRIHIVLEKTSELDLVLKEATDLKVEPTLGLRLRLASIGKGKWQNTGGEKAKFGLSAEQILQLVKRLKDTGKQHWICLLHFHMGSQIASLNDIKTGLSEAAQYFIELQRMGIHITTLDIGGGIGVDYEGSASKQEFSVNYSLQDYASAVVECFSAVCKQHHFQQPEIITEAGRAMTAHHAVLVTDVVNAEQPEQTEVQIADKKHHPLVERMQSLYLDSLDADPVLIYQQLSALYFQAQMVFVKNKMGIEDRALLEELYLASCRRLKQKLTHDDEMQQQLLNNINEKLADKLVCNLSVFQSIPDVWGISQIFPIVPLQRLNERPDRRAILQDLTCDSDGQIQRYVDAYGVETTLPVHRIEENEEYLFGIFMVGAYQEILGDMHNLFGDTNTINVELDEKKSYRLVNPEAGDTVRELLNYVHFDTDKMRQVYQSKVQQAGLSQAEASQFYNELSEGLDGYTYLE